MDKTKFVRTIEVSVGLFFLGLMVSGVGGVAYLAKKLDWNYARWTFDDYMIYVGIAFIIVGTMLLFYLAIIHRIENKFHLISTSETENLNNRT